MAMPNFDVEFTKDGAIFDRNQLDALLGGIAPVTDLLVLSHGWNNDRADAAQLYDDLGRNLEKLLALCDQTTVPETLRGFADRLRGRTCATVRTYWPSKKSTDAELMPGGGSVTAR